MPKVYGRDLDLNLLRVFAVVAECGSVTAAAARLYLTQPAVSAAVRGSNVAGVSAASTSGGRWAATVARRRWPRRRRPCAWSRCRCSSARWPPRWRVVSTPR